MYRPRRVYLSKAFYREGALVGLDDPGLMLWLPAYMLNCLCEAHLLLCFSEQRLRDDNAASIRIYLECCYWGFAATLHTFEVGDFFVLHLLTSSDKDCMSNKAREAPYLVLASCQVEKSRRALGTVISLDLQNLPSLLYNNYTQC